MKWVVRIVAVVLGLIVLAGLAIGALIAYDHNFPAQTAADFTNIEFPGAGGQMLSAYVAQPPGEGPFPGLLLVHEFYGLNADIVKKADLLAQQGYVVLAVDAYRGQTTRLLPRAIWLVVSTPQEVISQDLDAGYAYLAGLPQVDAGRVGALGFCFGGTQVMHLGVRNGDLRANVIFYGSGPISDAGGLGLLGKSGPVLGIYGAQDSSIPLEEVRAFEQALLARQIAHRITIYPTVGHAFVTTESIAQPGAAQDAWQEMLAFMAENLNP